MQLGWLINPISGGKRGASLERILCQLKRDGVFEGEVVPLTPGNTASAVEGLSGAERIIVAGGDGTVSQVLGLIGENTARVGVFPLGTGNDLARELWERRRLGHSRRLFQHNNLTRESVKQRIETFLVSPFQKLDLWRLEYGSDYCRSRIFCNYASFGYEALIVHKFDERRRRHACVSGCFGAFGNFLLYAGLALGNLQQGRIKQATVRNTQTGKVITLGRVRSVFITNIRKVMGIGTFNHDGHINDKKIEMLAFDSLDDYLSVLSSNNWLLSGPKLFGSSEAWEIEELGAGVLAQVDGEPCPEISAPCRVRFARTAEVAVV